MMGVLIGIQVLPLIALVLDKVFAPGPAEKTWTEEVENGAGLIELRPSETVASPPPEGR